jgi:two-component system, NarL family, sensor kinase
MKTILLLLLTLSNSLYAQSIEIDSIKSILNSTSSVSEHSNSYLQLGIIYFKSGSFDTAIVYLNKSLFLGNQSNNEKIIMAATNNLGNVYADMGEHTKALGYFQKANLISEQLKDAKYSAQIYKNIGAVFVSLKRFDESLKYYYKAEKTAISLKDSLLIADCNNNLGTVFEQQNDFVNAIRTYSKAMNIYEKIGSNKGISMSYSNLAIVFKLQKNYEKALEYNFKSVELSTKLNDKWMKAATLNNIGNLYGELGNYENAKKYCNQSLELSREIHAPEIIYNVYESLSDAALKVKDYPSAYAYHKMFKMAQDSFSNTENNKQLSELNVKYESEKKEKENVQLKFDNDLKSSETQKANHQRNLIILLSLISIGVGTFIYKLNQKKQIAKQKLEQYQLINSTVFETEQLERERIARDLHDSVGQKLSVVKMQLSMKHNDTFNATKLLDEAIDDVRIVSHNLMPTDLNKGLISAVENMCEQINFASNSNLLQMDLVANAELLSMDKQRMLMIYRMIQELLNNAIKYARASSIHIMIHCEKESLMIKLEDNGLGFEISKMQNEEGIGLKNIRKHTNQLKGNFEIISNLNIGTTAQLSIPI